MERSNLRLIKSTREPPRAQRSTMQTLIVPRDQMENWRIPPFQRPLRVNEKVRSISAEIKENGGVISGVITLGQLPGTKDLFIVDGQHRKESFLLTDLAECLVDIRIITGTMADLAEEFVRLNSNIVRMRPDDILRGLESTIPALHRIRDACPFVGYDQIRRQGSTSPVLGMSQTVRCWTGSVTETPTAGTKAVAVMAAELSDIETENLIRFLTLAKLAWGREPENFRLWASLNLCLSMWLYRRLVLLDLGAIKRAIRLNNDQFKKCLMAVSASRDYVDWLYGRNLTDRDRSPAYNRLKQIFAARLREETGETKILMPSVAWASH